MTDNRALIVNSRGDYKAVAPAETHLPDDSTTRQQILHALSSTSEARSWPNFGQYLQQAYWYTKNPWVYLAVNQIARTGALVKLNAFRMQDEQKIALTNHPIEQLLRKPNAWQSQFELIEQTIGYHQLTGNAYWFLYSEHGGQPDEIILLRPDRMRIVAGQDSRHLVAGYVYYVQGIQVPIEPEEVIHFKRYHPLSDYYGLSPLEALAVDVQSDTAMAEYNRNFFGKDMAVPAGVVNIKNPISTTEFEGIKEQWRQSYGGRQRRTAFLQGAEVEYQDIGLNNKESEFMKGRQFEKELIMMVYGIPPGMLDKTSTQANAQIALEFFTDHTVWPVMQEFAQKLTRDLCPFYSADTIVEPEDIRPKDAESERTELQAYGPYLTINEIRARYLNLPAVSWGDQPATGGGTLLAPSALRGPNSIDIQKVEADKAPAPAAGTPPAPQDKARPARQHDVGRTRAAQREVTQYAKFVLKRLGTDKESEIDGFSFSPRVPAEYALALKTLVEINPAHARWFLDEPATTLRESEPRLYELARENQAYCVKFTNVWEMQMQTWPAFVKSAVKAAMNEALDQLAMQTGIEANSDLSDALVERAAQQWFNVDLKAFTDETYNTFKAVEDPALFEDSPLLGETRARLFAREGASRLEMAGTILAAMIYAQAAKIAIPDTNGLWLTSHAEYRLNVIADDDHLHLNWTPLKAVPIHIKGNPLPLSEALRVEPFGASETDHYFAEYERLINGQPGSAEPHS